MASLKLVLLPLLLFSIPLHRHPTIPSPLLPPPRRRRPPLLPCPTRQRPWPTPATSPCHSPSKPSPNASPSSSAATPLTIFSPSRHLLRLLRPASLPTSSSTSPPSPSPLRPPSPSPSPPQSLPLPSKHLIVTSIQSHKISINNVPVSSLPLLDDGFLLVYAIDSFFDPNFTLPSPSRLASTRGLNSSAAQSSRPSPDSATLLECSRPGPIHHGLLPRAPAPRLPRRPRRDDWTLFAPPDQELVEFSRGFSEYLVAAGEARGALQGGGSTPEGPGGSTAPILNVKGML
ncbi:vegetative cell wall protein gp1-like [Salvia hispanica]|uniref:vegetative cell wall protein gp1-like n=1 Tax=Salvia hispanica TaxID=49212 RepID=UPI00200931A7|nr:vegetative cell wall protein gp1-like [Salvia hispanica]